MIFKVLNFLRSRLDTYISDGRTDTEPLIVLSNPWTSNDSGKGSSFLNAISLINVEEEKVFRGHEQVIKTNGTYIKKEPSLKLNLYILISAYNKNYEDALKFLSRVISFFQTNNVFTNNANEASGYELPEGIEHIIMELYTAGFEQQNQIWASLSTGYLPSVIYKARMVIVDADDKKKEEKLIDNINIKTNLLIK